MNVVSLGKIPDQYKTREDRINMLESMFLDIARPGEEFEIELLTPETLHFIEGNISEDECFYA